MKRIAKIMGFIALLLFVPALASASSGFLSENPRQAKNLSQAGMHRVLPGLNAETQRVCDDFWRGHAADHFVWAHNIYIALGLSDYLIAFRNAVAPGALIYADWTPPFVTSPSFRGQLIEALTKADTIYFNLQDIGDVNIAVGWGTKGLNTKSPIPPKFGNNYTNFELWQMSLMSSTITGGVNAAIFAAKIKWYNGTTPLPAPANFDNLWNPAFNPPP